MGFGGFRFPLSVSRWGSSARSHLRVFVLLWDSIVGFPLKGSCKGAGLSSEFRVWG